MRTGFSEMESPRVKANTLRANIDIAEDPYFLCMDSRFLWFVLVDNPLSHSYDEGVELSRRKARSSLMLHATNIDYYDEDQDIDI
mmetsp:Transcript_17010/g.35317  ORF Transcript_17010/g.35317 Transcript_17010/m.35317 type:complete len:85 (-) Transcript_17010:31-285(-)